MCILLISGLSSSKGGDCGSNDFQDYFDYAKESRVKQVPKNQEPKSFKNQVSKNQDSRIIKFQDSIKFQKSKFKNNQDQDSRLKIQESREDSIKISTINFFQNIE